MRDETRESMLAMASVLRQAWNRGAISAPGAELVLLAAGIAMDPDTFAEAAPPPLAEKMASLFSELRDMYLSNVVPTDAPPTQPGAPAVRLQVPSDVAWPAFAVMGSK